MAGVKSREVTFNNIEKTMEERHRFDDVINFIRKNEFRFNLMDVDDIQIASVISVYKELEKNPTSSKSIRSLHVDIDCSDALTGLKAVQREARKTTRALRDLEEQQKKVNISVDEKEIANAVMAELAKKESLKGLFK